MSSQSPAASRRALATLRQARRDRTTRTRRIAAVIAAPLLAAGAGALFVPASVAPTESDAATRWGGWAMETSFGVSVVAAAWLTFRALEVLYRVDDARALHVLPLNGGALAVERLSRLFAHAALVGVCCTAFVAPGLAHGPAIYAGLAMAQASTAALLAAGMAFGVTVLAGTGAADPKSPLARMTNAAGGVASGGVYQFAPGLAYALVVSSLLLLKLGLEEPLRTLLREGTPRMTRAGVLGVSLPLATGVALLLAGWRGFARHHDVLAARFADAETVVGGAGRAYFGDDPVPPTWWERRLGATTAALYRKDRLQYARGHAMLVAGSWLGGFVALLAVWGADGRLAPPTVAALGAFWVAVVAAPGRHMASSPGEAPYGLAALLADGSQRSRARGLAAARESLSLVLPLLLPALAWLGSGDVLRYLGLQAAAAGAAFAAGAIVARGGPDRTPVLVAAAFFGALAADAVSGLGAAVVGALMLAGGGGLVVEASRTPRTP